MDKCQIRFVQWALIVKRIDSRVQSNLMTSIFIVQIKFVI